MTNNPKAPMDEQRAAFEAHIKTKYSDACYNYTTTGHNPLARCLRNPNEYYLRSMNEAWDSWQAALASLPLFSEDLVECLLIADELVAENIGLLVCGPKAHDEWHRKASEFRRKFNPLRAHLIKQDESRG